MKERGIEKIGHIVAEWEAKGWLMPTGKEAVQRQLQREMAPLQMRSAYVAAIGIGAALLGVAILWVLTQAWYYVYPEVRMGAAVVLVLLGQGGTAAVMLQEKQGTERAEIMGMLQYCFCLAAVAMIAQTYYWGWSIMSYLLPCVVVSLPAIYLLRSVSGLILYDISVLWWTACGGTLQQAGGSVTVWVLLMLSLPFYYLLLHKGEEKRLAVFSWVTTITVFCAFALVSATTAYIPFLALAALAATIMLTGYTIDIRKAWGTPFRWCGRFAAVASLWLSCIPTSWRGIADIQGFHWTATAVTAVLFAAMVGLFVKGVKQRLWSPLLYSIIPVVIAGETVLVRSGVYSSLPLWVSTLYLFIMGAWEVWQGVRQARRGHTLLGILVLIGLAGMVIEVRTVSPMTMVAAYILVFLAARQMAKKRRENSQKAVRHRHLRTHITVKSRPNSTGETVDGPTRDRMKRAENLPAWMEENGISASSLQEAMKDKAEQIKQTVTVIPRPQETSSFVPPVFKQPEDIPLPGEGIPAQQEIEIKDRGVSRSPWQAREKREKKDKKRVLSPWGTEERNKK